MAYIRTDHYKENMYFTKIDDLDYAVKADELSGSIIALSEEDVQLSGFTYSVCRDGVGASA